MIRNPPEALTQTLKPTFFKYKAIDQLERTSGNLQKLLKQTCSDYILQAELTEKSNIHYHGLVTFISPFHKLYYQDNIRGLGFCLIKPIFELNKWLAYMYKDNLSTLTLLNKKNRTATIHFAHHIGDALLIEQMKLLNGSYEIKKPDIEFNETHNYYEF